MSRKLTPRRGRRAIDAYLVECLDCSRRYRLTDRTCPGCGCSVDKALPLYLRVVAATSLALALVGTADSTSPTCYTTSQSPTRR